jgi:hypothetical protein
MWGLSTRASAPKVEISIHHAALEAIFDECDRYDDHETGGRLIGTYRAGDKNSLLLTVSDVIESSPQSRRSATSFFQDGEYQEKIFRSIEGRHPEIEHMGNWHTHHVNGFPTLSDGDVQTYHRIVNHAKHNTNFFYALLVTKRNGARAKDRYTVKHFVLFRGNPTVYEIPASRVHVVDKPPLRSAPDVRPHETTRSHPIGSPPDSARGKDSQFFDEWYPTLRPYMSRDRATVYWRGRVKFIDDSAADVVIAEVEDGGHPAFGIVLRGEPAVSTAAAQMLSKRQFSSAREAIVALQREVDREMFKKRHND